MAKTIQKQIQEFNDRGLYGGWHAQQLQKDAVRLGTTMAALFRQRVADCSGAYSPYAKCVAIRSNWALYEYLDGSTDKYLRQTN
jgi:hypothetical protein